MGYAFTYDDLDRLLGAKYFDITDAGVGTPSQTSTYSTDNKFEEKQTYDVRGNILTLERNGLNSGTWTNGKQGFTAGTYGKIDNLQFGYYEGNKLIRVQENSLPNKGFKTTKSPTDYSWQYGYDANGNLRYDYNKGINWIWYNHLNLPTLVEMTNSRYITLNYTADGELVRKWTENYGDNTGIYMQEYVNGIEYKNWVLDRIPHPEGAVIRNDAGGYEYEYTLKDHLGSNRIVFRDKDNDRIIDTSDIKQINHTYPFGMDMEGNWNGSFNGTATQGNAYKYNGKEFNNDFGLGWYHYGARWYDPAIGRWNTVDPLAEKMPSYSPYAFSLNNPVNMIDLDGRIPYPITIRSFASFNTFAYGFHGDGRGYSNTPSYANGQGPSARAHQRILFDTDKSHINAYGWSSPTYKENNPGNTKTASPEISFTKGLSITNDEDNKIFGFGTHSAARNPQSPAPQSMTPNIDVFSDFLITENKKKGTLSISGKLTGDNYPSTEAFISDPKGQNVFIGVGQIGSDVGQNTGPFTELTGEHKDKLVTSFNFTINTDSNGNFINVRSGGKIYSLTVWNNQFLNTSPQKKEK